MTTDLNTESAIKMSAGAGIAIAGVWIACAGVSIIIMLILFVWGDTGNSKTHLDFTGMIILVVLVASPLIAAYSISKKILGIDD
jgi:hypothetical protein